MMTPRDPAERRLAWLLAGLCLFALGLTLLLWPWLEAGQ